MEWKHSLLSVTELSLSNNSTYDLSTYDFLKYYGKQDPEQAVKYQHEPNVCIVPEEKARRRLVFDIVGGVGGFSDQNQLVSCQNLAFVR